jgi:hypothetical protein
MRDGADGVVAERASWQSAAGTVAAFHRPEPSPGSTVATAAAPEVGHLFDSMALVVAAIEALTMRERTKTLDCGHAFGVVGPETRCGGTAAAAVGSGCGRHPADIALPRSSRHRRGDGGTAALNVQRLRRMMRSALWALGGSVSLPAADGAGSTVRLTHLLRCFQRSLRYGAHAMATSAPVMT